MAGITAFGSYVPWHRLGRGTAAWASPGERAVANFDEDSLTMAVAATRNCLTGVDRKSIAALYLATTTPPYRGKSNASILGLAADLPDNILCVDFANSPRAGTNALKSAVDAALANPGKKVLVATSDLRVPQPRSPLEPVFGDGAAALLVGDSGVAAEFEDYYSISNEILDVWREENDRYLRSWEDRFVAEEGYLKILPQAVSGLLNKRHLAPKDFAKAVIYGPDVRRHREMAKKLGFDVKTQVQDSLLDTVGNAGAAAVPMQMVAALEEAKPGDRILVANYGDGADALILLVTDQIEAARKAARTTKAYMASKKLIPDYETYLSWRGLLDKAAQVRRPPFRSPSPAAMAREVDKNLRFHGTRCKNCGYPQYPPQTICTRCHTQDAGESYSFSDRKATVFTYTLDGLAPTIDPPMVVAVINFEGGGRFFSLMTDRDPAKVEVGMPVEMTFRTLNVSDGIRNYFWKSMPIR